MAVIITEECIACGACEQVCPNQAIEQGGEIYGVDPLLCTECVGFFEREQCMEVCPVDAPILDPENREDEATLIARARKNNPEHDFAKDFPSRFKR